ncbi:MAG: RNA polymerase sigma factor [Thermoguttaceae bacterium]|nr:RNA polymerase sigma factor [Thermoguttaceae bacterium]MDW8038483.1 RNA polymerase sigma factor [Thermoguttaceae bacterium]
MKSGCRSQLPELPAVAPLAERTDEELLFLYRDQGDREAFETLVRRYERELYHYLRRYLGDDQLAEDAFQLTFLQVYLKSDQFERGRKFRPWLYAIATNQATDMQRRNRRHRMVSLDRRLQENCQTEKSCLAQMVEGSEQNPAACSESTEQAEQVRLLVDRLPEPLRRVVLLVYFQGLKYREAAQVLDIPVGTVKSRLHTAMAKLSQALEPTCKYSYSGTAPDAPTS